MGKGWHYLLGPQRLYPLLAGERIPPIPNERWLLPPGTRRVTPNHQALAWSGQYLYSHRYGTPAEQSAARDLALTFYSQQLTNGFMLGELLAPDPHAAYWLTPAVAFWVGALEFGHEDIRTAAVNWFLDWLSLMADLTTPDGEYFAPGTRCKGLPKSQVATALYREIIGLKQHGPHNQPCVVAFRHRIKPFDRKADVVLIRYLNRFRPHPRLRWPLHVTRTLRGYVATIDFRGHVNPEWVDRVAVLYSRPKRHRMTYARTGWTGEMSAVFEKLREEIVK